MSSNVVLIDDPAPEVRRITLNRPEKRNALNHALRGGIIRALQEADQDPAVRVMIVRGAGSSFSAGYDLGGGNEGQEHPWYTAGGDGHWPRHVTQGWMSIWELGKPVIAQVHGYCLAGGSELATCCDLVYMADDAQMGYPAVRFGVPDNHFHAWFVGMRKAMEMMLTGDSLSGVEAARLGWALGSVSARLCKARQRLLERLTARGVAPAAVVGIGLTAGAASAVPAALFDTVKGFPAAPLAASSGAAALARELTEGITMRVKLVAVATVVVAALGITGGPPGPQVATLLVTWPDQFGFTGPGTTYDVFRGLLNNLTSAGYASGSCFLEDTHLAGIIDPVDPGPGRGFYYLARAENQLNVSTWGSARRDSGMLGIPGACTKRF